MRNTALILVVIILLGLVVIPSTVSAATNLYVQTFENGSDLTVASGPRNCNSNGLSAGGPGESTSEWVTVCAAAAGGGSVGSYAYSPEVPITASVSTLRFTIGLNAASEQGNYGCGGANPWSYVVGFYATLEDAQNSFALETFDLRFECNGNQFDGPTSVPSFRYRLENDAVGPSAWVSAGSGLGGILTPAANKRYATFWVEYSLDGLVDVFMTTTATPTISNYQLSGFPAVRALGVFATGNIALAYIQHNAIDDIYYCDTSADRCPVPSSGGGGGGPGGGGSVVPAFPPDLTPACDLGPMDWALPAAQPGRRNVSIFDGRPEAVLVIQYVISWGDGTQTIAYESPIFHAYKADDIYTVIVRVAYRGGGIEVFVTDIDVRGNNCSLQMFVREFYPLLAGLGAFLFLCAVIVTATKYRIDRKVRRLGRRYLLIGTVVIFVLLLVVTAYAALVGIPI